MIKKLFSIHKEIIIGLFMGVIMGLFIIFLLNIALYASDLESKKLQDELFIKTYKDFNKSLSKFSDKQKFFGASNMLEYMKTKRRDCPDITKDQLINSCQNYLEIWNVWNEDLANGKP